MNISLPKSCAARKDLFSVGFMILGAFFLSNYFDLFGLIDQFDKLHPNVLLDDMTTALTIGCLCVVWYAWRRQREVSTTQRAAMEELEARNRDIAATARELALARDAA